jgi:hypothetical protein
MKTTTGDKTAKTYRLKALGSGKGPSDEQMASINKLALTELVPDQVYVRRYLMAHNGIDRDVERFTEDLLKNYAATLPGKGFFVEGHPGYSSGSSGPGNGRFFAASTEEMAPAKFLELTGEEINLPDGVDKAVVLWGDSYLLKLSSNADTLANIDGGIYSFTSIGFSAPYFEVQDETGNFKFGEYRSNGEALEGSLVWLGAQPGAGAQKSAQTNDDKKGGVKVMEKFLKQINEKLGKSFTSEDVGAGVLLIVAEKDATIKGLQARAVIGDAYIDDLIKDAVRFGVLVKEIDPDPTIQKAEVDFIKTWPLERIKALKEKHEASARVKFPAEFQVDTEDPEKKKLSAAAAAKKLADDSKKEKDYTLPENNELIGG